MAVVTEKRRKFIAAWLGPARYNATRAARIAGYAWPNKQGPALMQHPRVGPMLQRLFLEQHPGIARRQAEERRLEELKRAAAAEARARKDRRNARDRARRAREASQKAACTLVEEGE